jgi:cytochrome P450
VLVVLLVVLGGGVQGTMLIIFAAVQQRLPKYWGDDADTFRPERHLERDINSMPPFTFLPFLAGQRGCIGNRFALLEMKVVQAAVCRLLLRVAMVAAPLQLQWFRYLFMKLSLR